MVSDCALLQRSLECGHGAPRQTRALPYRAITGKSGGRSIAAGAVLPCASAISVALLRRYHRRHGSKRLHLKLMRSAAPTIGAATSTAFAASDAAGARLRSKCRRASLLGAHRHRQIVQLPGGAGRRRCRDARRDPQIRTVATRSTSWAKTSAVPSCCGRSGHAARWKQANLPPCLIGMEACVGAHHLSRKLQILGHDARLMPAKYVRPYSKGQKNDYRDAEAIAAAVQRPTMKFVATKTADQLDLQALHRVRERLVSQRTGIINQIRARSRLRIAPCSGSSRRDRATPKRGERSARRSALTSPCARRLGANAGRDEGTGLKARTKELHPMRSQSMT
jgi:Transposase